MNIEDIELKLIGVDRLVPKEDVITAVVPDMDNPIMDRRRFIINEQAQSPNIIGGSLLVGIIFQKNIMMNTKTGELDIRTNSVFLGQEWCTGGSYLDLHDIDIESDNTMDSAEISE